MGLIFNSSANKEGAAANSYCIVLLMRRSPMRLVIIRGDWCREAATMADGSPSESNCLTIAVSGVTDKDAIPPGERAHARVYAMRLLLSPLGMHNAHDLAIFVSIFNFNGLLSETIEKQFDKRNVG